MEEEKKVEGKTEEKTDGKMTEGEKAEAPKAPIITRSMMEETCEACPSCGAETAPKIPAVLPDPSWSTEKLVEATKDENMLVRSNAILILSKRSPSEALEPLIEALKDDEYIVKTNAMVAIAAFGQQVAERMISALEDPNPDVRAGAAWILGELKDQRAVEALEKAAQDEYPLARIQAKASLVAIGRGPKKAETETEEKKE
ncbi:MAG TPA: HEAT repeat domain-containing protein [Methanotrichaceae archaeon]|nr:HEAT repeat domain-containing protein [Methanotrichaceae archaeon]